MTIVQQWEPPRTRPRNFQGEVTDMKKIVSSLFFERRRRNAITRLTPRSFFTASFVIIAYLIFLRTSTSGTVCLDGILSWPLVASSLSSSGTMMTLWMNTWKKCRDFYYVRIKDIDIFYWRARALCPTPLWRNVKVRASKKTRHNRLINR